ncbi:MAG: FkbM family methyltransferase [Solirubrobacteraceae bacterium]
MSLPGESAVFVLPWGLPLECRPAEHLGGSVARTGVFEIVTTEVCARLAAAGELAVDVGANYGYMTSVLTTAVGPGGRVLAFEPNGVVHRWLVANVARWRAIGVTTVQAYEQAVSDAVGTAILAIPLTTSANDGLATLETDGRPSAADSRLVKVETVSLDSALGPASVGVMKIDIEGHELAALRGASRLLDTHRIRDILFEDHQAWPNETTRLLEGAGYELFDLSAGPLGVRLLTPGGSSAPPSWDAPMRLATTDPDRAHSLMRGFAWRCLTPRFRYRGGWRSRLPRSWRSAGSSPRG